MKPMRFGKKMKAEGRAQDRQITVYADSKDEMAVLELIERLSDRNDPQKISVSRIYGRALRAYIEMAHPDIWQRLYARDDPKTATR